jgi:anti-sigma regulatory factor (Ser/Thr protein kinase)
VERGDGPELLRQAVSRPDRPVREIRDDAVYALLPPEPAEDVVLLVARLRAVDSDLVASWPLACEPAAAAAARGRVREQLAAWGLEDEVLTAELVASELVTNAVRHGSPPLRLRLIRDRALTVEVSDAGPNAPRLRHARANDEGGRGLLIVARLAQGWGARYTAHGKVIWAQLATRESAGDAGDAGDAGGGGPSG